MNFLRRWLKPAPTQLGRWQLHYDPKIVHYKVDQANEDHCGCCGESAEQMKQREQSDQMKQMKDKDQKKKWQKWQEKKQQALYAESENYYIPYVM
jgi:hypothetical protein